MAFAGIPLTALDFYEDLENDNSKAFWTAQKHRYDEHVRAPLAALSAELEREFGPAKLFRPYRDVRFATDKTPYKTSQGVWFGESSCYFQVSAAGLFVAAGYWDTAPAQVERLRRAVDDDVAGAELERALAKLAKHKSVEIGGEQITRVPTGYPKDHPRVELLRYKTLTARRDLGCPPWLSTPRAKTEIAKAWRSFAPLVSWLDTHVGSD
ncbi:DUF2461 domain-containing protein [uncultured Jatrophihabitans sp.]|uniref:DUF2461 domain-containing protein n=1 Tax=uncultured Jatrophihabitans sp. TaxID=1610747 RepID=UPI0035CBD36A